MLALITKGFSVFVHTFLEALTSIVLKICRRALVEKEKDMQT